MQVLLVYSVVTIAAVYAGWKFMPAWLRSRLAARIGAFARKRGLASKRVVWLEANLNSGGTCGSCDSCNACGSGKRAAKPSAVRER